MCVGGGLCRCVILSCVLSINQSMVYLIHEEISNSLSLTQQMHTEVAVWNRNDPNKFTPLIELYQCTAGCLQSSLVM